MMNYILYMLTLLHADSTVVRKSHVFLPESLKNWMADIRASAGAGNLILTFKEFSMGA